MQGKKVVSSTVILKMQAAWKTYVNCRCNTITMPIKVSSYATWSTT